MPAACRTAVLATLVVVAAAGAQEEPGLVDAPTRINDDSVNLGFPEADDAVVDDLLGRLSAVDMMTRESAAARLSELGPRAFRRMAEEYREGTDYEARIRIEQIAREQYLWHTMLKKRGFLGIAYQPDSLPRLPERGEAIRVTTVRPNSAAAAAGLRRADLIVAIDGNRIGEDESDFADLIQDKGAGGKVEIEVLRGNRVLTLDVVLGHRPLNDYDDVRRPELLEELNRKLQVYSEWWAKHFSLPQRPKDRFSSVDVLEIPE